MKVSDIREQFKKLKADEKYVIDKTGCKLLEIVGATFDADEDTIFGDVNRDYVAREIAWYESMSRNVNDIPGGPPVVWARCATKEGLINSNYGYLIWSEENGKQYDHVLNELKNHPDSRRAVMIYTRPSIWDEYNKDGMSDFICTNTVQYLVRDDKLVAVVQMRSNDAWAGYRNDFAWQQHVQKRLADDLGLPVGKIIWSVSSLHLYERNFYLVDAFTETGRHDFTLKEWQNRNVAKLHH